MPSDWYVALWPKDRPEGIARSVGLDPQVVYKHDCQDIQRVLEKMANGAFAGLPGRIETVKYGEYPGQEDERREMAEECGETKIRVPREVIGTLRLAYAKSSWYEISARQSGDEKAGELHHDCLVAYGAAMRHLRQASDDPKGTQWQ